MTLFRANWQPLIGLLALGTALLANCGGNKSGSAEDVSDTTTTGNIRVSIDNTFQPILTSHVDTFLKLYPYAHVKATYKSEGEVMQDLLEDSVRAVVVSRPLRADEQKVFDQIKIIPRVIHIATDGVAVVVNPANPDSMLTLPQLRAICTGELKDWSQIRKGSKLGAIRLVFDQNQSSTARYVQDSVTRGAALTKEAFASESNPKVIEYVASHPNAIGVIGVNWISDIDDEKVKGFLKQVRVAGISTSSTPASPDDYVQPYQAYLAQKTYPLRRDVYVISREARSGLGTGFSAFLAGRNGQLIFLKSGLLPAVGQVRLVKARPSSDE
jgi:phosphate transport system substrate-binding protein